MKIGDGVKKTTPKDPLTASVNFLQTLIFQTVVCSLHESSRTVAVAAVSVASPMIP
jgi:hypothetical protein